MIVPAVLALGLGLTACGAGGGAASAPPTPGEPLPGEAPPGTAVVRVGHTAITRAQYEHWMRIGDATAQTPQPGKPLPKPVDYEPPDFTACVAHLRANALLHEPTSQLKAKCQQKYKEIQTRTLGFLIYGYWLREEAAEKGVSVSNAELQKEFAQIRRKEFPTAAALHRLLTASRQGVPDLKFTIESQMLSTRLEQKTNEPVERQPEALIQDLYNKWAPRTDCLPGYVVKDCRQFH
jgi:hypothetical protein